jgi:hypothetical protein
MSMLLHTPAYAVTQVLACDVLYEEMAVEPIARLVPR